MKTKDQQIEEVKDQMRELADKLESLETVEAQIDVSKLTEELCHWRDSDGDEIEAVCCLELAEFIKEFLSK